MLFFFDAFFKSCTTFPGGCKNAPRAPQDRPKTGQASDLALSRRDGAFRPRTGRGEHASGPRGQRFTLDGLTGTPVRTSYEHANACAHRDVVPAQFLQHPSCTTLAWMVVEAPAMVFPSQPLPKGSSLVPGSPLAAGLPDASPARVWLAAQTTSYLCWFVVYWFA